MAQQNKNLRRAKHLLILFMQKKIIHSRKEKPHYSISKTVIIKCSPNTVRHARHVDEKISASFFLLLNVACLSILYVISVVCELLLRLPWTYIYIILCTKNKTHEDDDNNEQRENANRWFFFFFQIFTTERAKLMNAAANLRTSWESSSWNWSRQFLFEWAWHLIMCYLLKLQIHKAEMVKVREKKNSPQTKGKT